MRLIFCYARGDSPAQPAHFQADGLWHLFKRMLDENIIDECFVVVDGAEIRKHEWSENFLYCAMPDIRAMPIREGSVFWVRAGFKPTDYYSDINRCGNWLLYYGANTGHERWPFWDIVFDDLDPNPQIDAVGRAWLNYAKPVHPDIFRPRDLPLKYDVCIGASYIHDKKGQWLAVEAVREYQKRTGRKLRCIMPGSPRHGIWTDAMMADLKDSGLNIDLPGMVTREQLAQIFNQSRVFIHCGSGQNDRSLLEALACGCWSIVTQPKYHAPWIRQAAEIAEHTTEAVSRALDDCMLKQDRLMSRFVVELFQEHNGLETVILPRMRLLFDFLKRNPKPVDAGHLAEMVDQWARM